MPTHSILISDSRAINFEYYNRQSFNKDVQLKFVCKRGAKINELLNESIEAVQSIPSSDQLIIELAVGINNLTELTGQGPQKSLSNSVETPDSVLADLLNLKRSLKTLRTDAIVGIVNIPNLSFLKYNKYIGNKSLGSHQLCLMQLVIDGKIDVINRRIERENRAVKQGPNNNIVVPSVYWNRVIRRSSKKRRMNGSYALRMRNHFDGLYDGLHGKSDTKRGWFDQYRKVVNKVADELEKKQQ